MGRVIPDSGGGRSGPLLSNPSILGVDLQTGAELVAGMVGTAFVNDKLVGPLTDPLVAGFRTAHNTGGQFVDAATTIASAYILHMGAKFVTSKRTADMMLLGGGALGVSKGASALVPGLSISARYPDITGGFSLFGPKPAALPAAGSPTALAAGIPSAATGLAQTRSTGMGY